MSTPGLPVGFTDADTIDSLRKQLADARNQLEVAHRDEGIYLATLHAAAAHLGCDMHMVDVEVRDRLPPSPPRQDFPVVNPDFLVRYSWYINCRAALNFTKLGPQNIETVGLAISKEAGELAQVILQLSHNQGHQTRIWNDAINLGALCVQVMRYLGTSHGPLSGNTVIHQDPPPTPTPCTPST